MQTAQTRRQPRQKRAVEKVSRILDAVEALVSRHGVEALTTTHVADEAGYAVGTIYQYFSNRTALLIAAHDRLLERLTGQLAGEADRVLADHSDDLIAALVETYIESARSQPGYLSLLKFVSLNKSTGDHEAATDAFAGDLISSIVRAEIPHIDALQMRITRTVVVGLISVLVDVVLLESDENLRQSYQAELVAHCTFALQRAARQSA